LLLGLLSLDLDDLLDFLVVSLALLLDIVELLDKALFSLVVLLVELGLDFFFLGSLLRSLAFSNKLDLVVVIFGLFLNFGYLNCPVCFSGLELLAKAFNFLLTKSTLHG